MAPYTRMMSQGVFHIPTRTADTLHYMPQSNLLTINDRLHFGGPPEQAQFFKYLAWHYCTGYPLVRSDGTTVTTPVFLDIEHITIYEQRSMTYVCLTLDNTRTDFLVTRHREFRTFPPCLRFKRHYATRDHLTGRILHIQRWWREYLSHKRVSTLLALLHCHHHHNPAGISLTDDCFTHIARQLLA